MKSIVTGLTFLIMVGFIDLIDNNIARVEFVRSGRTSMTDIRLDRIPCKVKEGDTLIALEVKGVRVYLCDLKLDQKEIKK